ncbi:argininosuccinate lyase [Chitinophaga niastensis]|uniref:Argininosuccinate lyase n=1 Tax=Chitinophaga niastensis TaxID=536980 RepID=A0A2P8HKT1_CHINA|nr:argininosuccinate lyase [Chitinophaga niastensis]PSL46824.1 argininosuccinate lyase [Chitinophaga niastensis]
MKLWQKDKASLAAVEKFTVGKDREMDAFLAPFDVLGSLAHITMLQSIGLLEAEELAVLKQELGNIYKEIIAGDFKLEDDVEDIHSQVELLLTRRLGEVGKKIHSGRSRNDQVLVDLKLYLRHQLESIVEEVLALFQLLQQKSEEYKAHLIPGYTHLQIAMPSSFGLWFGAYAESLVDDLTMLQGAYKIVNKNPLGSAAGYGSSFPLNREMTTALLGFETLNYNVVYAQMGRGKTEKIVSFALAGIAATIAKMAMDACLFMNQNFGFISFPDELTTGSSIMPHKKNPDVWELIRSHGNKLQALPNEIAMMITNLPSGYHRDLQLLKENLFPAFGTLTNCIRMSRLMLENIRIKENILADDKYQYLFSVEVVNNLVLQGTPFREAYKQVGKDIENGTFTPGKEVKHTHAGSIGNLCTAQIAAQMNEVVKGFPFENVHKAFEQLLDS